LWRERKLSGKSAVLAGERELTERNYSKTARLAWVIATLVSLLVILSPVSGIMMIFLTREHQLYNIPPILYTALGFLLAASITGLSLPIFAVIAWKNHYWSLASRLLFSAVALAALLMMPMMNYWNVLGFRF
jgi:hypothetical protein